MLAERVHKCKEVVQSMCDVMDELVREAKKEEEEKHFLKTLSYIRNLMLNLDMTARQVMDAMNIPSNEQEKFLAAL